MGELMDNKLHSGHRKRVKERFLREGLDSFESHQVLELLLFYGIPYRDTNDIAHRLLDRFGTLSAVFEAETEDIASIKGVGKNTAILLSLIPQISRLYFSDKWGNRPLINNTTKAGEYAVSLFTGRKYEVFYLICLNSQNRVNYAQIVHRGTINESPVYPRLIVEAALRHQANSVILAHNHPGGSMKPSGPDMDVTKKIKTALESISINVYDHIIVAGNKYISMKAEGFM